MQITSIQKNTAILLFVCIILLAAILRLYNIGNNPIYLDEGYSHWIAGLSYKEHWTTATEFGVHPVLYYSLLKFWMSIFGDSLTASRGFSAFASILTLPFVFIFAKNIGGKKIGTLLGLLSILLIAVSPQQHAWSHLARPYMLMTLGVAITCAGISYYLSEISEAESKLALQFDKILLADIMIVFGGALTLWSHNMSLLFIASAGLFILWWFTIEKTCSRELFKHFLKLAFIAILLWLPHAYFAIQQAMTVTSNIFYVPDLTVSSVARILVFLFGTGQPFATIGFIVLILISKNGLQYCSEHSGRAQTAFLLFLLILPLIFEILIGVILKPLLVTKTHIWVTVPFVVAIAFGIISFKNIWIKYTLAGAIILACLFGIYTQNTLGNENNWRTAATKLFISGPTIPILIYPNELALPLAYEARKLGITANIIDETLIPLPAAFPATGLDRKTMAGVPVVLKSDVSDAIAHLKGAPEFWLVRNAKDFYDPGMEFITEIKKRYNVIEDVGWALRLQKVSEAKAD